MKKTKTIWNPLNPNVSSKDYERRVGKVIENLLLPGMVEWLFKDNIESVETLQRLSQARLVRRTEDKPRWLGVSGFEHQIDESFSTVDEKVILLVECKHWHKAVDYPSFSAFLVRLIDITTYHADGIVLGMIVTPQGYKGKSGGNIENQDCIAKLQNQFNQMGYYISLQLLPD